jgi:hypothetical protein
MWCCATSKNSPAESWITGTIVVALLVDKNTDLQMRFCPEGITQPGDKVTSGTRIMCERRVLHKGEVTRSGVAASSAPEGRVITVAALIRKYEV